jgi:hypothetical protein
MPGYRCLLLGDDLRVIRMDRANHADDATAKKWGIRILAGQPSHTTCEIWNGDRMVFSITGWTPTI